MTLCRPAFIANRRAINRKRRREKLSRAGKHGNAARRLAMLSDPARAWRIVRIGTWLDPATGRASRWVVSADGERNVALRVNGSEVCCGKERVGAVHVAGNKGVSNGISEHRDSGRQPDPRP